MKKYTRIQSFCFVCTIILCMSLQTLFAQKKGSEKVYNLAVYATGIQNDQKLSSSIQTVTQNRTITMLTSSGKYRLIERSGEFLQQIRSEQSMQQSGDVADGQIAELGAGFGAEKICVVSVTIIDNYLYIATRIVDVATKSSFESGDAETNNYTSLPFLTQTLEIAVNKMLGKRTPIKLFNNNNPTDVKMKSNANSLSDTHVDTRVVVSVNENEKSYAPSKVLAGLCDIFLSPLGIGHFIVGQVGRGVLDICFCWTGIPEIIGLCEGIVWICMPQDKWVAKFGY